MVRAHARGRFGQGHRFDNILGGLLMTLGLILGTFGTVAGLTVLFLPAFPSLVAGVVGLGMAPLAAGGALAWQGNRMLERHAAWSRVEALPEAQLVLAAHNGATAEVIAGRLGTTNVRDLTARLDDLTVREVLDLRFGDDGALLYEPRDHAGP